MIRTLLLTLVTESLIAGGFAHWQRKPLVNILLTASLANVLTQWLLWLALTIFYNHYLPVLLIAEILVWLLEGLILHLVPANQLTWRAALLLGLGMNLASFGLGWSLPV